VYFVQIWVFNQVHTGLTKVVGVFVRFLLRRFTVEASVNSLRKASVNAAGASVECLNA
jgi:hypothetical protein